jgi:hypothetical protein
VAVGAHPLRASWLVRGLALLSALAATALRAQVPEFPDSLVRQQVLARTERYEATHTTSLWTDYRLAPGIVDGTLRTYLTSSTTLLGDPTTRDQVDAAYDLEYRLSSLVRPFLLTEGTLTNDANSSARIPGLNNTASAFIGIGGRLVDDDGNHLGVAVGGTYNRQLNVHDAGRGVYAEGLGNFDLEGYRLRLEGEGRWYDATPRHNTNGYLDMRISRDFEEGAVGDLEARYERINTDLYIRRSEDDIVRYGGLTFDGMQRRGEGRFTASSSFNYPMSDELALDLSMNLATLDISQQERADGLPPLPRDPVPFKFDRSELQIGAVVGARWTPPRGAVNLRLQYATNEQSNTVEPIGSVSQIELDRERSSSLQNDFITEQVLLAGSADFRVARYDTVGASASIGIYRYDTPSPTNYFDKDEQAIQGEIRYSRSFSPSLDLSIYGQVFLTHLVYLFGQNSNDNNWNRVFRVAPSVVYRIGEVFQNYLQTEVVANYTEYDFEGRTQNIRGRSFRELHIHDSLGLSLTPTLRLLASGELRVSERGSFSWDQFAESPLERTRTEGLGAEMTTRLIDGFLFGVGGRLSRVKNFRADPLSGVLVPFSDRTSVGPTARFEASLSERSQVSLTGWWEHRFVESSLVARIPILFLTVGMKL